MRVIIYCQLKQRSQKISSLQTKNKINKITLHLILRTTFAVSLLQ